MSESCDIAAKRPCAGAFEPDALRRSAGRWLVAPLLAAVVTAGAQFAVFHHSHAGIGIQVAPAPSIDPPAFVRTARPLVDLACPKADVD